MLFILTVSGAKYMTNNFASLIKDAYRHECCFRYVSIEFMQNENIFTLYDSYRKDNTIVLYQNVPINALFEVKSFENVNIEYKICSESNQILINSNNPIEWFKNGF